VVQEEHEIDRYTIAIADDDELCLVFLRKMLEEYGYNVVTAENGKEIIEKAIKIPPDLFLLDITMSDMDGFETCKVLKSIEDLEAIPVIFVSSLSEPFSKLKGFELGAVDYIDKPFTIEEAVSRVRTHLSLSSKIKELEKMNAAMINREMRVIELKKEVNSLSEKLNTNPPYDVVWSDDTTLDNG